MVVLFYDAKPAPITLKVGAAGGPIAARKLLKAFAKAAERKLGRAFDPARCWLETPDGARVDGEQTMKQK